MWTTAMYIVSIYVQNYRPNHEQTTILLDQLQKHFFSLAIFWGFRWSTCNQEFEECHIKCYNLPFFGLSYGNVDNYSLF